MLVVKLTRISYVFYFIFTLTTFILHILSFVKNTYVIYWESTIQPQIHHLGFQTICTTDDQNHKPTYCNAIQDVSSDDKPELGEFNRKMQISIILFIVATVSVFINLLCALVKFQTEFNRTFCPMPSVSVTSSPPKINDNNNPAASAVQQQTTVDASIIDNDNTKLNSIVEKKNSNNILWILTLTVWSLISFIFDVLGLHFIWPTIANNYKRQSEQPDNSFLMIGNYLYFDSSFRLLLIATILTGINALILGTSLLFNITHVDDEVKQGRGYFPYQNQNTDYYEAQPAASSMYSSPPSHYGRNKNWKKFIPTVTYHEQPNYEFSEYGTKNNGLNTGFYSKAPIHVLPNYLTPYDSDNKTVRKSKRKQKTRDKSNTSNNPPFENDFATYI